MKEMEKVNQSITLNYSFHSSQNLYKNCFKHKKLIIIFGIGIIFIMILIVFLLLYFLIIKKMDKKIDKLKNEINKFNNENYDNNNKT